MEKTRNGVSYRATRQVKKWNKESGREVYYSEIIEDIPAGPNARGVAYDREEKLVKEYKGKNIKNLSDPTKHKRP